MSNIRKPRKKKKLRTWTGKRTSAAISPAKPKVLSRRHRKKTGSASATVVARRKSRINLKQKPKYYVTTAIAYPNGPPHIGHAYELIATDAIARFMRLDGYDVFFLTGTDEHGIKILQTAAREGLTPRQLLDRNVPLFQAMVAKFNCSNDDYIRTTEPRHYASSQAIWRRMQAAGDIYLDKYSGWYSVRDEAYYDESETRLDNTGQRIGPQGTPVEWVQEESYFFRLSAYGKKLIKLYKDVPNFVLPKARLNEVASFVRRGLKDLSISRTTFDWGISVPKNGKHIMYVWVDALTNYITAVGFPNTKSKKFRRYWPADLHVIGKDIVRFHAVYWPAFLMSAGIEVPRRIFSHGFLFNRGEKMSKSVGNVIDPFALADTYGVDPLRYFLLREVPFGQDGNYSHEAIVNRINADLANDLGNLAQRSLSMIARQFNGVLPSPGKFTRNDTKMFRSADGLLKLSRAAMTTQQLHKVLEGLGKVIAGANRYFAGEAPWALAKTDPQRQGTVLYVTAEVLRQIAILAQPFMPQSAEKLLGLLAVPVERRTFTFLGGSKHRIASGVKLPAPVPVFPRYVEPEQQVSPKPQSTNLVQSEQFERRIERIHRLLEDESSTVTWNDRILDPDNPGRGRQVDVSIRRDGFLTLIECRTHKQPQDVTWIEELIGRRVSLHADAVIAVSASGFTKGAKAKAAQFGIILRDFGTLTDAEVRAWGKKRNVQLVFYEFTNTKIDFGLPIPPSLPFSITDEKGRPVNWRGLFEATMSRLEEEQRVGEGHVSVDINAPISVNGARPTYAKLESHVRRLSNNVSLASVVCYSTPKAKSVDPKAFIANLTLGTSEIIESSDQVTAVVDLSQVKIPSNCLFYRIEFDFGRVVELKGIEVIGAHDAMPFQNSVLFTFGGT
jgi:methionyl-tRNA synthetase